MIGGISPTWILNIGKQTHYIDNIDEFLEILGLEKFRESLGSDFTIEDLINISYDELILYRDDKGTRMKEFPAKRIIRNRNKLRPIDLQNLERHGGGKRRKRKSRKKTKKRRKSKTRRRRTRRR